MWMIDGRARFSRILTFGQRRRRPSQHLQELASLT